jgi:membrane protease YdiL (CAAX protease family)
MKPSLILTLEIIGLLVGWASLRLRHLSWRDVGLKRPDKWLQTIGLSLLIGVGYQVLDAVVISPVLQSLTGKSVDLSQFSFVKGSLPALLLFLIVTWTEAAFIEEMFFHSYFFNRLTDFTGNDRIGVIIALFVGSLIFGAAHIYQGMTGVLDTFLAGLMLGLLYIFARRNLWLPILTHGILDTIGFIILFSGLFGS